MTSMLCLLQVQNVPHFQLSATEFQRYWISFDHGSVSVGTGQAGSPALFSWKDPSPRMGIRHIGLAAWDKFVAYRNIRMHKPACSSTEGQVSYMLYRKHSLPRALDNARLD